MSRIEANIATQLGDLVRSPSAAANRQLQNQTAQVQQGQEVSAGSQQVSAEHLYSAAAQIKQVIETASSRRLSLDIDRESNQAYMRVTDTKTGEMIKQIPSKEMLELHNRLQDFIGLFINRKV